MLKLGKTKPQVLHIAATFRKKKYRYSFKLQTIFLSNALDKNILLNGASLKNQWEETQPDIITDID